MIQFNPTYLAFLHDTTTGPPVACLKTIDQPAVAEDRVELSDGARSGRPTDIGREVRWPLIAQARSQIAMGAYETDQKIDLLTDRLFEVLTDAADTACGSGAHPNTNPQTS